MSILTGKFESLKKGFVIGALSSWGLIILLTGVEAINPLWLITISSVNTFASGTGEAWIYIIITGIFGALINRYVIVRR